MPQICQCKNLQTISDNVTGEIICKNCGTVLESHTIGYTVPNEKNTTQRYDYGIGTEPVNIKLSHRLSEKISRNESLIGNRTMKLFVTITSMLQKISATQSIKNDAYALGRKCTSHGIMKGRTKINVSAACVMAACKVNGKMISETELLSLTNSSKKQTRKIYRIILEQFGVKPIPVHEQTRKLICRICSDLNIPHKTMTRALELLEKVKHENPCICSHPGTVSATMVYVAAEKKYQRKKIAGIVGISNVNIGSLYRKMMIAAEPTTL